MNDVRFSIIPGWVVCDPRLKPRDLQVLCVLGRHTNRKHGWCRRSQVKMAEQMACARSTVQAAIDRLVEIGAVECRKVVSANGRDSAHWYRVVYDRPVDNHAFDAWQDDGADLDDEEFGPMFSDEFGHPPADISAPPADLGSAPPAGPEPAPINDYQSTPHNQPRERGRVRAGFVSDGMSGSPLNADLIKRVQKFCTGDGYREGEWPKWAKSTIGHIAKQFAHLAAVEQDAACEWRDAFLAKCKRDRVGTPMPVANYFRDKVWTMLVDADKAGVRPVAGGAPAVSGGKVAVPVFGPAFAAARSWSLVSGPVDFDLPADLRRRVQATYEAHFRRSPHAAAAYLQKLDLVADEAGIAFPDDFEAQEWMRRTIDEGYPEANRLHEAAKDRNHVTVDPVFERLKDLCEAVPIGSQMWERWRSYHEERGWPFVPTPAAMRVVFFPKGGPEGLDEFEEAARAAMNMERSDDHAA